MDRHRTVAAAAAATTTAAALAAVLVLDGCGSSARGAAREPSAAESRTLERAEQILISRCMAARGFPYAVTEVPDDGARSFPYALDDVAWAREHGYGGAEERAAARAREDDPNQRWFRRLSAPERAAARTALMGAAPVGLSVKAPTGMTVTASADGCIADAQRSLYGDPAAWFRVKVVTMNLRPVREARVRGDAQYTGAVAEWAACMKAAGRPHATPDESRQAAARYGEDLPPAAADAAAAELAVVEATCATDTRLARVSQTLDRAYGEELRTRHRAEITLRWRLQNEALPKARRLTQSEHDTATETSGGSHA